jgi:polyribonucleotide nucleotidyltransferase
VIPERKEDFPFTLRIVSDILESNGSSSMATVCGGSLALMDAGCKADAHVAGIAMGLIKEGEEIAILSDILGDEDHLGDMDFKVCGTRVGVTAIQMDIKIAGVTRGIMEKALEQAREGRIFILGKMEEAIAAPRPALSPYAPRTHIMYIKPERIKDVIGSGGKIIKSIIEETGVKIDIEDDGKVTIFSVEPKRIVAAEKRILDLTADPEIGMVYNGRVTKIMDFGAFVEILPGTEGLVHISQLAHERVATVDDIAKEGDKMVVKVLEIDRAGKIRLSRKEAIGQEVGKVHVAPRSEIKNLPPPRKFNQRRPD